jgi:hypothetical protein
MKETIFKAATAIAGVYHIILAFIGLCLSAELTAKAAEIALGVTLKGDSQLMLVARFAAAYMLAFGIMLLCLAANPRKFRLLAFAAVALFGIRFLNRILLFNLVSSTFGMSATRNIIGTAIIFVFFAVILLTIPKKSEAPVT